MDSFLRFFVRQRKFALVFTVSVIAVGLLTLQEIRRDMFPAVDFEVMSITTGYPSASPEDVEKGVTDVVESALKNLDGIDSFSSSSREGVSSVIVTLSQEIDDIQTLKADIRTAMSNLSLPDEVDNPRVIDWNTAQFPILQVNIDGSKIDYKQAKGIADELEKHLAAIKGVANVEKKGYLDSELQIRLDTDKLNQYQISPEQVRSAISSRNARFTVGDNNDGEQRKNIVILTEYENISEIESVVIKSVFDGPVIKVADIAEITRGNARETDIIRVNGTKGFVLSVKKQKHADVIRTVDLLRAKVEELRASYPQELRIFFTHDQSEVVRNRLDIVTKNGIVGLVLVLVVLGAFLSFKTAFWVAVSLPVSLLGTVALLGLTGETINLVSLAAMILVLGIVVDDSIIIAESIHHYKVRSGNVYDNVVTGFKRVILPVITTILTSIVAMSSMFLMTGTMGKFIYLIPIVVIFALGFSFLEVSFALPAHLAGIKSEKQKTWFQPFENWFEAKLIKMLAWRYWVVALFSALFGFSLWFAIVHMPFTLFPSQGSDAIHGFMEAPTGSSSSHTEGLVIQVEDIIIEQAGDDLNYLTSDIGSWFTNQAQLTISLIPSSDRQRGAQEIVELIETEVEKIEGIEIHFDVERPGPPTGEDLEINLVSSNNVQRDAAANAVEDILGSLEGIGSIERNDKPGKARIETVLDFDAMSGLGIDYMQVYRHLRLIYSGLDVTNVRFDEKETNVRIYLGEKDYSESFIAETKVMNNQGRLIPMSQFSTIREIAGEPDVNHFDGERSVSITASAEDGVTTPQGAMEEVITQLDLSSNHPEVRLISGGGAREIDESMDSFRNAFIMSIFGVFLLLMLLFNSWSQPMLVISSIPFSLIGVIWAFYFHGETLSFFAVMGSLALIGVIVNDSLVMVSHLNFIKSKKERTDSVFKWIAEGSKDRLRAVVLTSLTTLAGVLPLAYGIGGIDYLLQPMVLALGYGLLFGTIMTLILLPCLYLMNYQFINWLTPKWKSLKI
ncbi:MAG: efflux RND transporter permease subunit [Gammaproteobacteria bacterium]|nr:efflux RND transporter permease subunit [Gammaproteobacteria bacterium]